MRQFEIKHYSLHKICKPSTYKKVKQVKTPKQHNFRQRCSVETLFISVFLKKTQQTKHLIIRGLFFFFFLVGRKETQSFLLLKIKTLWGFPLISTALLTYKGQGHVPSPCCELSHSLQSSFFLLEIGSACTGLWEWNSPRHVTLGFPFLVAKRRGLKWGKWRLVQASALGWIQKDFRTSLKNHLPHGSGVRRGCSICMSFLFSWLFYVISLPPFPYKLNLTARTWFHASSLY